MAPIFTCFLPFFFELLLFCSGAGTASPTAAPAEQRKLDSGLVTITVRSILPQEIAPVDVHCSFYGRGNIREFPRLLPLQEFQWSIGTGVVKLCRAFWGPEFGVWEAYEPRRDAGHRRVYWQIRPEGFFLSWDNSTWTKQADWATD